MKLQRKSSFNPDSAPLVLVPTPLDAEFVGMHHMQCEDGANLLFLVGNLALCDLWALMPHTLAASGNSCW